jgi:hypothetical protein
MSCMHRYGIVALVLFPWSAARAQSVEMVNLSTGGAQGNDHSYQASMSSDGRFVAFQSGSSTLHPSLPTGGLFLRDRQAGILYPISLSPGGAPPDFGGADFPSVSDDGVIVVFHSPAANFGVPNPQHITHVYVRDRLAGTTTCIDREPGGNPTPMGSSTAHVSRDGRYVSFTSNGALVAGDAFNTQDVFRYDLQTGAMECASVDSSGNFGSDASGGSAISGDGRFVAFDSNASNLVPSDTNATLDVFVHDFVTGTTTRVSVSSSGGESARGSGNYHPTKISADGNVVAFMSLANEFSPLDTDNVIDLYARDVAAGTTRLVNLDSSGAKKQYVYGFDLSGNGRFVAFTNEATDVVPNDTNGAYDIFLRDLATGVTTRESVDAMGVQANQTSLDPVVSADGRYVAFHTFATNLVPGDLNGKVDILLRDRAPAAVTAFCLGDGSGSPCPCANSGEPNRGCQNSATTGGAVLAAIGAASLGADTLHVTSYGERPSSFSVLIQGTASVGPLNYGDGLRCVGGMLKRLYTRNASLGVFGGPQGAEPSISSRSAALGDPILAGTTRYYQVQYRDPTPAFCPIPTGNTWNASTALSAVWDP